MKTPKTAFVCSECEYRSLKWMGRCPSCGAWNTLEETLIEPETPTVKVTAAAGGGANKPVLLDDYDMPDYMRFETGYRELDRVLGGGAVAAAGLCPARSCCSAASRASASPLC